MIFGKKKKVKEEAQEPIEIGDGSTNAKPDFNSSTWHFVENWASKKLKEARKDNDERLDIEVTSILRGRIQNLKDLINLKEQA